MVYIILIIVSIHEKAWGSNLDLALGWAFVSQAAVLSNVVLVVMLAAL